MEGRGTHFEPAVVSAFMACERRFRIVQLEIADE